MAANLQEQISFVAALPASGNGGGFLFPQVTLDDDPSTLYIDQARRHRPYEGAGEKLFTMDQPGGDHVTPDMDCSQ